MEIKGDEHNQTIILTDEEKKEIDEAVDTIINKYLLTGDTLSPTDRDAIYWSLLGILRFEGMNVVKNALREH